MSYSPLVKIIGLVATSVAHYYTVRPPTAPPTDKERTGEGHIKTFEAVLPVIRQASQVCVTFGLAMLSEAVLIASRAYPDTVSLSPGMNSTLCPHPSASALAHLSTPSALFLLGVLLSVSGCAIRLWCYSALGNLFTYEIAVRPKHVLVRHGPYGVVRHPSYTGIFLDFFGVILVHFAPGGWRDACGVDSALWPVGPWMLLSTALCVYAAGALFRRGSIEDDMLHKKFGKEWEEWARDVPSKYFPWIV
ncbi:hypothetical protein BDW22DRAFT_1377703 [Trametopsis cervina]|nr:hypothetical protein BDW22DRAFT_1377703 [Trametopsis cervina]